MADTKLSALTELAAAPAIDDEVYIRDVSEAAAQESKRITMTNLLGIAGALGASAWVIASDAPAAILAWATILEAGGYPVWVCSGADDDVQIQAAIDACTAGYKETIKLIGTFAIETALVGESNTILDCTEAILNSVGDVVIIDYTSKTNFEIIGGLWDGDTQTLDDDTMRCINLNTCTWAIARDLTATNGGYYGLSVYDSDDCRITNVTATDNRRHGIHNGGHTEGHGWRNIFDSCTATGNTADGINNKGNDGAFDEAMNNTYINCISNGNGGNGFSLTASVASATAKCHFTVIGCKATGNTSNNFVFQWCRATISNIRAIGSTAGSGIRIIGCNHISIDGVAATGNTNAGAFPGGVKINDATNIGSSYITITNSDLSGNWRNVYIYVTAVVSDHITIENCDVQNGVDDNWYVSGAHTWIIGKNNPDEVNVGETVTISKAMDHSAVTDDGGAVGHFDFDDDIPEGSVALSVRLQIQEKWDSDNTTTLHVMVGYAGDLDAFSPAADPGTDIENTWNHVYASESLCQDSIVSGGAKTPVVTLTEDNDITEIISGAGAAGIMTVYITYMKM